MAQSKKLKVGINSADESHLLDYYSKVEGLLKAAWRRGLDWRRIDKNEDEGKEFDVIINWEEWKENIVEGKKLTILWLWDTYRTSMVGSCGENKKDLLRPIAKHWFEESKFLIFRAHATFYHASDIDPRGRTVYWMPPAVDAEVFKRAGESEYDISWVGQDRHDPVFGFLKDNFKCNFLQDKLEYNKYVEEMSKGRIVLNVPRAYETNKRIMEAMAIGPMLAPWGPDYTIFAIPNHHFLSYGTSIYRGVDKEAVVDKVGRYLGDDEMLQKVAQNGRKLVEQQFTFDRQLDRILTILDRHLWRARNNK